MTFYLIRTTLLFIVLYFYILALLFKILSVIKNFINFSLDGVFITMHFFSFKWNWFKEPIEKVCNTSIWYDTGDIYSSYSFLVHMLDETLQSAWYRAYMVRYRPCTRQSSFWFSFFENLVCTDTLVTLMQTIMVQYVYTKLWTLPIGTFYFLWYRIVPVGILLIY